jgi:hypothetical protein
MMPYSNLEWLIPKNEAGFPEYTYWNRRAGSLFSASREYPNALKEKALPGCKPFSSLVELRGVEP